MAKLAEMGTTGLIGYVVGTHSRRRGLAMANVERVLRARFGATAPVALARFKRAVMAADARAQQARHDAYRRQIQGRS